MRRQQNTDTINKHAALHTRTRWRLPLHSTGIHRLRFVHRKFLPSNQKSTYYGIPFRCYDEDTSSEKRSEIVEGLRTEAELRCGCMSPRNVFAPARCWLIWQAGARAHSACLCIFYSFHFINLIYTYIHILVARERRTTKALYNLILSHAKCVNSNSKKAHTQCERRKPMRTDEQNGGKKNCHFR